jgi:hypothetical protein
MILAKFQILDYANNIINYISVSLKRTFVSSMDTLMRRYKGLV